MAELIIIGTGITGALLAVFILRTIYNRKCKMCEMEAEQFARELALYKKLLNKYNENGGSNSDKQCQWEKSKQTVYLKNSQ